VPDVAFVLGGGGVLGASEVGMLRALVSAGVAPDLVIGTSVGAVNGAVFALDGILIGAGDQRYLAYAMVGAAALFVPAVVLIVDLDLGIGWLWLAIEGLMVARLVPLALRYRSDRWLVLGAPPSSASPVL